MQLSFFPFKKNNKTYCTLFPFLNDPKEDLTLTSTRLKFDKTAATAAVQNFVLGDCGICLPMGTDFGQPVTRVIHFEKRT